MSQNEILESLKKFLEENISYDIKFKKAPKDGNILEECELVKPVINIAYLPPKNIIDNYDYEVPAILIMIDEGEDDNNEANLNIRLALIIYDPGEIVNGDEEEVEININTQGYKDIINLIDTIRIKFAENTIIKNKVIINKPFKWEMDSESYYPYYVANVYFGVTINSLPFIQDYQKDL